VGIADPGLNMVRLLQQALEEASNLVKLAIPLPKVDVGFL